MHILFIGTGSREAREVFPERLTMTGYNLKLFGALVNALNSCSNYCRNVDRATTPFYNTNERNLRSATISTSFTGSGSFFSNVAASSTSSCAPGATVAVSAC
jgi:hypothetical protein